MSSFFFLLLFLLLLSFSTHSQPLNPDILGLLVFKSSLSDPSSSLSSWSQDSITPCQWSHIACHPKSRRVTRLSLSSLRLSGHINRALLNLEFLQSLDLSNNSFSGFLNPFVAQLPNLKHLDFSDNELVGEIPISFFQQCGTLESVNLSGNKFYGEIPNSVGNCDVLLSLNLSRNHLSGSLPNELLKLKNLESLDLSANFIVGEIPVGIGELVNLKVMDFSKNLMTGWVLDEISKLWRLNYLNLGSNSFSGKIPNWIGELKLLKVFDFSENGFDGLIPDSIGKLNFLERLNFSGNVLIGNLPESIKNCTSLKEIDFSRNLLMGNLPFWIFELGLDKIMMSGNKLNGNVQIPAFDHQNLLQLDLSRNMFSGEIPNEIEKLSKLVFLNLSWNSFSGSIPKSLVELKTVKVVDLSANKLNGGIPVEIGEALSLKDLILEKNFLNAGVPDQIGNCSSLTSLKLSQNSLSGSLPSTLSKLTNLQTVDLSYNSFSGPLPKNLSNLPNLLSFNISHNQLTGPIPSGSFFNTIPLSSLSDNPGLCGSIVNRSCPSVLPKPLVLNPNSSFQGPGASNSTLTSPNLPHKKIILSISAIVAIGAAILIAIGVLTITVLNIHARSNNNTSSSAAALTLSNDYYSRSPATTTDANSGKLVMFSGDHPDFASGAHAILNKESELGRGGFGTVYKTVLGDGRPVAIKKLTVSSLVKSQDEFEREIKKLGKISHPNLVSLQGYYWTQSLQLIIYEFVSGESLHKALHESDESCMLSWNERFDVIIGIAKSLAYLHCHSLIHYNLKSGNVLIDGSGEAKVGDYGLARLLPMLDRYVLSNKIQSTLGYMAPEFACGTVKINEKCDVYGFGVLVLEIVTGRRPVEYMEDDVVVLCDVVRGLVEGNAIEECVDVKLGGRYSSEEVVPVVKLGLICTSQVPSNRPDMGEVVKILEMIRCPGRDELSSG